MSSRGASDFYYAGERNEELPGDAAVEIGVAEGFVRILRQLGDLAQLAAEVFQGLHDQAMAVSARGRHLALRLNHLDHKHPHHYHSGFFSSHKHHCLFVASNLHRVQWRANLVLKRGVVAGENNSGMPGFMCDHIERCRGPPKLSLLDKYDADGEGACLKRYTNSSFYSQRLKETETSVEVQETSPTFKCSEDSRPPTPKAAQCSDSMPEIHASQGFLSIFRQLKYRHANGSLRPQMHSFQNEATPEVNMSSNRSTESTIKETEDITVGTASVSEEGNGELERTSSFEAWLSPNAHILQKDQMIAEEMSHYTCNNGFVSHVTQNDAIAATADFKEDSNTYRKKSVSKRSKYKGGMEFIASRVRSRFPRKLFSKKQDPRPLSVADSFRNMTSKILELKCSNIQDKDSDELRPNNRDGSKCLEKTHPVNLASPSFQEELLAVASDEKITECTQEHFDDASLCEDLHQSIVHRERNGSPVPKPCSTTSITQEDSPDPTAGNASCSEGPREDMVPPLPPIQWLSSVKVRSGSRVTSPKLKTIRPQSPAGSNYVHPVKEQLETDIIRCHYSVLASHMEAPAASDVEYTADNISNRDGIPENDSGEIHDQEKDMVQPSDDMESCDPTEHSDEVRPELEIKLDPYAAMQSHQEEIQQTGNGDSDCNKKPSESFQDLYRMGKETSATQSNGPQVDNSLNHHTDEEHDTNVHPESVFSSAAEQLTKMNPPPVPRPKYSLLQVRTAPGLIYPSRKLSGEISKLPEQINDKPCNLKPVLGRGSNVTVDHSSAKVASILQRVDNIRQDRADNHEMSSDSEVSWSDSD
ncbi:protein SCAR1-like isoform X2 [Oryza brachyantha]|uniref:protein SCAR1-like isoform X2 n=1 Tax=Oryza brachyantha TaxID=4533 RepID=UPI001ADB4E6A|nr:protein SCAR1-like isoform X2 [Oryza brachyantha]